MERGRTIRRIFVSRWLALVATAWFFVAARAGASEPREGLEFQAPPGCPGREEFSAQVGARTARWERALGELAVRVEIRPTSQGLVGRVELERQRAFTVREIEAESCMEVVRALALIVAILVDPEASEPREPLPIAAPVRTPEAQEPPPPGDAEPGARFVVGAGVALAMTSGIAPVLAFGQRWHGALLYPRAASPAVELRLAASRLQTSTLRRLGGSVAFRLDSLRLEGCGSAFSRDPFELRLCATGEAGALVAEGEHPLSARSQTVAWGSLGGLGRALVVHDGLLEFSFEAGAFVPLSRYRFWFGGAPIHESPELAAGAGLGLGVRFP